MTETLIPPIEESRADLDRLDLRTRMFVDGAFRDAVERRTGYVTENPATGQPHHRGRPRRPGRRRHRGRRRTQGRR